MNERRDSSHKVLGNVRRLYVGVLVLAFVFLIWVSWRVMTPFVFAAVLTYLLAPVVLWFEHRGINRLLGIFVAYALTSFVVIALILYLLPLAVQQSLRLVHILPGFIASAQLTWDRYLEAFHEAPVPSTIRTAINQAASHLQGTLSQQIRGLVGAAFGLVPGLISIAVSPILAFYLLKDLNHVKRRFWNLIPLDWQPAAYKLGLDLDRTLAGYVRGQLSVALMVGILSAAWTAFLGIPFAVLIGLVAAVTDIIPYIGPIVGALPAVLLGTMRDPVLGLYALGGFIAIHQIEGTVLAPQIVGDAVGLHPLLVILAILVGGELGGLGGMLVAVPVAGAVKVLAGHLYRRLTQEDSESGYGLPP